MEQKHTCTRSVKFLTQPPSTPLYHPPPRFLGHPPPCATPPCSAPRQCRNIPGSPASSSVIVALQCPPVELERCRTDRVRFSRQGVVERADFGVTSRARRGVMAPAYRHCGGTPAVRQKSLPGRKGFHRKRCHRRRQITICCERYVVVVVVVGKPT